MKKIILGVVGIVVVGIGYWLISPFFIDKRVSESLPTVEVAEQKSETDLVTDEKEKNVVEKKEEVSVQEIGKGTFTGFDKVHTGSGTVRIITVGEKHYIRFDEDFHVNNGPDLYVGFGENGSYIKGSEVGKLKGNIGSQNYELPAGMDPKSVKEVWVWCKAFSEPFTKAVIQ